MSTTPSEPMQPPTETALRSPLPPKSGWSRRRWILVVLAILCVGLVSAVFIESRAQRDLRIAVNHLLSVLPEPGETGVPVTTQLQVLKGEGLPKQIRELQLDLAIAAPEHLRVSGKIDKEDLTVCRNGQQIWAWQPGKSFGLIAEPGVARFATAPETSIDKSTLGPLAMEIPRGLVPVLLRLVSVRSLGEETIEGERCRIVEATLWKRVSDWAQISPGITRLWVREKDGWPVRIGYSDGKKTDVLIALNNLAAAKEIDPAQWTMQAPPDAKVDRVALSHFKRFFNAAPLLWSAELPTLGPATGERVLVATEGKGRLELHDGTRVLFLRGTPEEMGRQHGILLKDRVRDLVDRVLYGVGVGSSFGKGRWFFGEIESCQSRIAPFIDPRYLREMDAMAVAAGLEKEEIRLANFFPELFHCSGFAVMGDATEGRRIYHGRILDYMKGVGLEQNAVVMVNQPDQGHAWVNVGYAGFVGSVTAMNEKHISIGEMGGRGEGNWDGKPMAQLVREVMEKASTLDEAVEIMRAGPRTCEYFYVIADGKNGTAVGIAATPETFDVVHPGAVHPRLPTPVKDAVLLSAGDRYTELVKRVQDGFGKFDADSSRELMTRPVCMNSNIHSVLFAPDTLDFWVANADSRNVASHTRYTKYNLAELLDEKNIAPAKR